MPRINPHTRARHRPGLLDFAWTCARCGTIKLGPPAADPADPPWPPRHRCTCRAFAWHESVVPAIDPAVFDRNPPTL